MIEHALRDTGVNPGGLMRCCTGSLTEWIAEQGEDTRVADGTRVPCRYCDSRMVLAAGIWRWDRSEHTEIDTVDPIEQDVPIEYIKPADWAQDPPLTFLEFLRDTKVYDPALIGRLVLSKRSDTEYIVIDGRTRLEALRHFGATFVPSLVYLDLTPQQEAQKFIEINSRPEGA